MAYGNWGAFVYLNGERQKNNEDCSVKGNAYHAVLGDQEIKLCAYKNYPSAFVRIEGLTPLDLSPFKEKPDSDHDEFNCSWRGEIMGYKFTANQYDDNMIDLYLRCPNGDVWTSKCGYGIGAGFED